MIDLKTLKSLTETISILYVEDDPNILSELKRYLDKIFGKVETAENGAVGLEMFKKGNYDIILSDISMPVMNGLDMSKNIREIKPNQEIIIVSAYASNEYFIESIKIGVSGYIIKPIDYEQIKDVLYQSALKINALKEAENYKQHLLEMVDERTSQLKKSVKHEHELQQERIENYEKTIFSFIDMVERRDTYTAGHSERVANYSKIIAQDMGYSEDMCNDLFQASKLHDIGKVATPDSILLKPGKLNALEYQLIQEHVQTSYDILQQIPMYEQLSEIIYSHHERHDGSGYPRGLKGDEIPLLSRVMIVADAFDAMTTNRIYKSNMSVEKALEELKQLKGIQFHPDVVNSALKVLADVKIDKDVSQLPKSKLEEERFAYFFKDSITDAYSKSYLELILNNNPTHMTYHYMYGLFIQHFGKFNTMFGWEKGDQLLRDIAHWLMNKLPNTLVFRIHGDDFIIITHEVLNLNEILLLISNDIIELSNVTILTEEYNLNTINIQDINELENLLPM